jgi:hypothetical protein
MEKMEKLFASFTANKQKQLREQAKKHTMETTQTQTMNDHRTSAHFTAITKPLEILFDVKPENWPEFEHHLLTKTENPTIGWKVNGQTNETI